MPIFIYKAKNEKGDLVRGKVEARLLQQASDILKERGLFVISLNAQGQGGLSSLGMLAKVRQNDIIGFTRQLSTMITAGLSLLDALQILERQAKPALQKLINELIRDVEGGTTFAHALKKHPEFSRIYCNLVKAGEAAGVLQEILKRLADNLENEKEFRGKVKGALIYPVIVVTAMIAIAFLMMVFVVPKLSEMYKDFGAELPIMTQVLISSSQFMSSFWYVFIAGAFGGVFGLRSWYKTPFGARKIDMFRLKLPVFGVLAQKIALTEFARTLALLLSAGISLLEALEIVKEAMDNVIYRDAIGEAYKYVEKGSSLSIAIERYQVFPSILAQMIAVGEETGQLDEVLNKLSSYFSTETEQAVKGLTTALEPMIMIILGLGVGFLIIAIVMPIYSLTSQF